MEYKKYRKYAIIIFSRCSSLELLPDISIWNTQNVKNMEKLFYKCIKLANIPKISILNINNP